MNMTNLNSLLLCENWSKPNHILFQMANICLLLTNLAPNGIYGIIYIRMCLFFGSMCFGLWGWLVLCSPDTTLWNILFTLINLFYTVHMVWSLYPFYMYNIN